MAALTEKELARLEQANVEIKKLKEGTDEYKALSAEIGVLKKKELDYQKELNRQFGLGLKSNKINAGFTAKRVKSEEALNKSLSSRIQNIAKGNILQGLGFDGMGKSRSAQLELNKLAEKQSNTYKNQIGITNDQRVGLQSITQDIQDGLLNEAEARERVFGLGIKNDKIRQGALNKTEELRTKQKDASKITANSAAKMKKFQMYAGLAGIAVGFIVKALTSFSAKIDEVGQTFGFLTNKNEDFRNDLIQSGNNAIMLGKNLSDVLSVTSALSSEFGLTLKDAEDLSLKVLDTAVATGLSNDEAQNLFGTFMQIGDLTAAQAENLIESTAQLAAQEGVAPNAVLKDMAASAEEIATFTQDGGQNIAEAAIQARKMGISLSTTAKIAEGLLDFESSIQNEIEASVLIGKQLNFQKARELALNNDIAGATKAVVDQLGSEEEFNKLNAIQRQSIAKSIGVSVAEMKKLVGQSDKLTLSGALAGKTFDDLVGQDSLSALTAIVNTMKSIGATLLDTFGGPVSDFLQQFTGPDGLENIKKQLIAIANIVIDTFNTGRDFMNTFRFGDKKMVDGFELDTSGNITQTKANDLKTGPGGINYMSGPAGSFKLNPRDSVLATTNPIRVNDMMTGPAGSMGVNNKPQTINIVGNFRAKGDVMEAVLEGANNQPGYNSLQPRFG